MLKRLHLILFALLCGNQLFSQNVFNPADPVITYNKSAVLGSAANPNVPGEGIMAKWIRSKTSRVTWNTDNFKSYIFNGMSFRVRFPNNYNPANGTKYPVVLFFHGGGEPGPIYDNELNLANGAQLFEQRINNGEWNGFLIFPQVYGVGWDDTHFSRINNVLDTLQKYNHLDPDRLIAMGLSEGGYGATAYTSAYPERVAANLVACPPQIRTLTYNMPSFIQVPIWIANGGLDVQLGGSPWDMSAFIQDFRNSGGNIYQHYYATIGHINPWAPMWNQKTPSGTFITDVYWNTAHKAQPLVYYGNQQACTGTAISSRMGISAGYFAYEWQKDGTIIGGATGNEYTATQPGAYRVRFMRIAGGNWSDWTPNPVVISTKACAIDTLFAEHFNTDNYYNAEPGYTISNFGCMDGVMTTATEVFSQDATGVQGNRFLLNYTGEANGCTYAAGDRVWSTYQPVTVLPNTNYEYSFYVGNQTDVNPAQLVPVINGTPIINGVVQATGTGNASWRKFTFGWNSGAFTYADLGIVNRLATGTGNDFVLDEIAFKIAPPAPGCTSNKLPVNGSKLASGTTATLVWAAAERAMSYDVYIWSGANLPASPVATVIDTFYNPAGLSSNTQYNWYVVPKNITGAATGCSGNKTSFTIAPPSGTGTGLKVDVFNNTTLSGNPVLSGINTTVNANWGTTSFAPGIVNADLFSIRWSGQVEAEYSETYSFITTSDDGVRLWVNGQLLINNWTSHAPTVDRGTITLVAGVKYNIVMEYYDAGGGASIQLAWSSPSTPQAVIPQTQLYPAAAPVIGTGTGLKVDIFNNTTLTGNPAFSTTSNIVNANWGTNIPVTGVNADNFSIRWTGQVQAQYSETYTFITTSDDGVRLWVNGQLLINNWTVHGPTVDKGTVTLIAGTKYNIVMEYYDAGGGASIQLAWSSASTTQAVIPQSQLCPAMAPVTGSGTGLKVDLFNNTTLTGNPVVSAINTTVNANWGTGSPTKGINADNFAIRWTGQVQPQYAEAYTFITTSDDGVRLWVNGQLVINNWTGHAPTIDKGTITLAAGIKYDIKMEYYDGGGGASIQLAWSSPSTAQVIIPQTQLYLPATSSSNARMAATGDDLPILQTANLTENTVTLTANTLKTGVYPNPVVRGQNAVLQINSDKEGTASMQLLNATGNVIQNQRINIVPGANTKSIGTAALAPGLYIIRITGSAAQPIALKLMVK